MATSSHRSQEHEELNSGIHRRSSSLELDVLPPRPSADAKGKGRYVDGQETVEEDADDTSDAEVEGLLHKGKVNIEDGTIEPQSTEPRRPKALGGGRSTPAKKWMGRVFGDMSRAQRKLFVREMLVEMLPILLLALVGAIVTGMLLVKLQDWRVFIRIEELFILVPILLNLKGNLEMNLAARFSTSANIGELDLRLTRRSLILGNLALLQVQALIVSLISGLLSFLLGLLSRRGVHHALQHPVYNPNNGGVDESLRGGYFEALLVLCVSMLAASISSGVLGSFMCSLVVLCRRYKVNPDNIATPLASALGDMVTLVILGVLSSIFAKFMGTLVSTAVFVLLLAAVGVNVVITFRNAYVQELLTIGWGPLFLAMAISSGSGLVLEAYVNEYEGFGLFAPVLTAISGAAGSIYVSRISTSLHSSSKEHYLIVALSLFALTCPVLFLFFLFVWATGQAPVTLLFAMGFMVVTCVQVALSLTLAYHMAFILWRMDYDPDVYALPLLSSFLDVSGQLLLVGAFAMGKKAVAAVSGVDSTVVEGGASLMGLS
ncbi:hypothetical protein BCR35DRAFT_295458 [Leucosporidium creatinivorum]|uniref:SLC41A/MgtE integral membrane domain-containing protein n=1 Tax=Leucosporidium creatinivorum TaxID=106004 RepID=A0A1Y2DS11_9BASI|nr:hypothetical protein BCR35DRAFT_295458 [Leucosporidium creatinivorum]